MTRSISLQPTADAEEPKGFAGLYFYPPADLPAHIGVTRVPRFPTHTNYFHSCYFSDRDFDAIHRVLQTERPLFLQVNYETSPLNPGSVSHRTTTASLRSGREEPIGEGPADADAA